MGDVGESKDQNGGLEAGAGGVKEIIAQRMT